MNYDLRGIDASGIGEIQSALDTYKEGIDDPLNEISSQAEYASAFKGSSIAETMKSYLDAVVAEILKMTAYIDDFRASLDVVAANYETEASDIAGNIGEDTEGVTGTEVETTTGVMGYTGSTGGGAGGGGTSGPGTGGTGQGGTTTPPTEPVPGGGSGQGGTPEPRTGEPGDSGTTTPQMEPDPSGGSGQGGSPDPNPNADYNFNDNGIDTGRIATNAEDAVNGNFIPEDHIYHPSFESEGVTTTEVGGAVRIDNNGIPIGFTDVIGGTEQ